MRNKCPDEEKLGDYVEGVLENGEISLVETHLAECEMCRSEVVLANDLLRGGGKEIQEVPDRVTKSALDLVNNEFLPDNVSLSIKIKRILNNLHSKFANFMNPFPWWRLGLTPIRGSHQVVTEDLIHVRKYFKDIKAEIEFEKIRKNNINIKIRLVQDRTNDNGLRVTLMKNDREVSSVLADKRGTVLFDSIPCGHYKLVLLKNGSKLGEYLFEIKEHE